MIGKIIGRISSMGGGCRGLKLALQMYYTEETFTRDVLIWWLVWDKNFPSWTWRDMKLVLRRQVVLHLSSEKVATTRGPNSLTTKPVDSSKKIKKEDSQLLLKAEVPEPTFIHGCSDSLASGLHPSASSCDTQSELKLDDTDDASDGLSMMAKEIHSDCSASSVKGQRSNIFQSKCKIQDKICKLIMDGGVLLLLLVQIW